MRPCGGCWVSTEERGKGRESGGHTSNRFVGRNFHFRIIVHSANAPNAIPPTTQTTIIAVFVPPDIPDVVPPDPAAAADAVDDTDAVLIVTAPVRAERVVAEAVGGLSAESVTVLRTVETSWVVDEVLVLVDTGALEDSTEDGTSEDEDEVLLMVLDDEVIAEVGTIVDVLVTAATVELELLTAALELELADDEVPIDELATCVETTAVVLATVGTTLLDVSPPTAADDVLPCPPISIDADES